MNVHIARRYWEALHWKKEVDVICGSLMDRAQNKIKIKKVTKKGNEKGTQGSKDHTKTWVIPLLGNDQCHYRQ